MKYLLCFLIFISLLAPCADRESSFSDMFSDIAYNYITCLDRSVNYLVENVDFFSSLHSMYYEKSYDAVMDGRIFIDHLVSPGETLDDIIKMYNLEITNNNIDDFRKVIYAENPKIVSSDYTVKSGYSISVPSE